MDIEEKRKKVSKLCSSTPCEKCPLFGERWDHYLSNCPSGCLWISGATEEELDRALQLFEDYYAKYRTVNTCVSCGAEIPEGRQVCSDCEVKGNDIQLKNDISTLREEYERKTDPIKPEYYNDTKITPFDVIDDWGLNFYLGNAVKYIKRAGKKAGNSRLQDLKKIREYIDHEIRAEE